MRVALGAIASAAALGLLTGCASLRERDAERERTEAVADHARCTREAAVFPSESYTTCRRRIAEDRQRQQWMELSLAQLQTAQRTPDYLPTPPPGVYIPIDAARYRCVAEGEGDARLVLCRER